MRLHLRLRVFIRLLILDVVVFVLVEKIYEVYVVQQNTHHKSATLYTYHLATTYMRVYNLTTTKLALIGFSYGPPITFQNAKEKDNNKQGHVLHLL